MKQFFRFDFMAISDQQQKIMPSEIDRDITTKRANPLAYKEAVRLINPQNRIFKGQVQKRIQIFKIFYFKSEKIIVYSYNIKTSHK